MGGQGHGSRVSAFSSFQAGFELAGTQMGSVVLAKCRRGLPSCLSCPFGRVYLQRYDARTVRCLNGTNVNVKCSWTTANRLTELRCR